MKVILIIFMITGITISGGLAYWYYQNAFVIQRELEQERYMRISAEESIASAKVSIDSLEFSLGKKSQKLKSIEKLLKHAEASKKDLEKRLDRSQNIRDILNKKIEELKQVEVF